MSAFIVEDDVFDLLISFIEVAAGEQANQANADKIGQLLLDENYRSVNSHYRESEPAHRYQFHRYPHGDVTPWQVVNACDCLDYQSCETQDWPETKAKRLLDTIRDAALLSIQPHPGRTYEQYSRLPGYNAAAWGVGMLNPRRAIKLVRVG